MYDRKICKKCVIKHRGKWTRWLAAKWRKGWRICPDGWKTKEEALSQCPYKLEHILNAK
jgi:hypothetical protein